jgi:CheY-like chemotaxis protein
MKNRNKEPIFIVDDDQGILDSFEAMLGDEYQLVMVDNGTEALELIIEQNPRLLFLDLKIPGYNGLEVLKRIREIGITYIDIFINPLMWMKWKRSPGGSYIDLNFLLFPYRTCSCKQFTG